MNNKKMFEEHDCEWKNESSCEDEVEDNGINFNEIEGQEFGEYD